MLKKLLSALSADAPKTTAPRPELAAAALLVHAARSDGDYAEGEIAVIDAILARAFQLDPAAAKALRVEAETAEAHAADLVRFTREMKAAYTVDEREAFLVEVWRVVLADDVRDVHEDVLMRRLAALLYVPDARAGAARLRAQKG